MFLQFNPQWFEPDFYVICVDPRAVQFCSRILPLNRRFRDVSLRFRGLCQGLRNADGGGYKLSSFDFIVCIPVFHVIIRTFYYCIWMGESDTIAQWFRLRPPSWFESQAHHLCFFHLYSNFVLYLSLRWEEDENKQKGGRKRPVFLKKSAADAAIGAVAVLEWCLPF